MHNPLAGPEAMHYEIVNCSPFCYPSHEFVTSSRSWTLTTLERWPRQSARSNNSDGPMSDPSIVIAESFKQFSQATVSAVHWNTILIILLFTHFRSALTNKFISKMACCLALLGLLEPVTPVIPARQFSATSDARHSSQITCCW